MQSLAGIGLRQGLHSQYITMILEILNSIKCQRKSIRNLNEKPAQLFIGKTIEKTIEKTGSDTLITLSASRPVFCCYRFFNCLCHACFRGISAYRIYEECTSKWQTHPWWVCYIWILIVSGTWQLGLLQQILQNGNRIYNLLKEQMLRMESRHKFMTVPAAIRELEKIEMVPQER